MAVVPALSISLGRFTSNARFPSGLWRRFRHAFGCKTGTPVGEGHVQHSQPAAIAAESRSAPAASVVMMHDDYLAKLQTDPYFRPVKPAASEPTPATVARPEPFGRAAKEIK